MGIVVTPALTTYTAGREVVHALLHPLIAEIVVRTESVDLIRGYLAEILDEFGHFVNAAPEFVTQGEHPEGGMMTIGAQDVLALFMKELHKHRVFFVEVAPEG